MEPINKPNRTNTVFTDAYVRHAFNTEYFPNQFTVPPHDGDKVKVGDQELMWCAGFHGLQRQAFPPCVRAKQDLVNELEKPSKTTRCGG